MEQTLKHIGNSMMLSVSPRILRQKKLDGTTRFEQVENDGDADIVSFRVIRSAEIVFPKVKGGLSLSPEIEELLNDPVYPSKERLGDPRIQDLLYEDFC